jgi:hypothetical protein
MGSGWAHLDPLAVAGLMSTESCIALVANLVTVILSYCILRQAEGFDQ